VNSDLVDKLGESGPSFQQQRHPEEVLQCQRKNTLPRRRCGSRDFLSARVLLELREDFGQQDPPLPYPEDMI
jgi:hypothetical protein